MNGDWKRRVDEFFFVVILFAIMYMAGQIVRWMLFSHG